MQISTQIDCTKCGEAQTVPLSSGVIDRFKATLPRMRPVIQTVFPNLTLDEREMLKTGLCPKCWDIVTDPGDSRGEPRRPHHAQESGHSDGEGYDGEDR